MPKLEISIYQPIEIVIDGTSYKTARLNRAVFAKLGELQAKEKAAPAESFESVNAAYEQLAILIEADKAVLDNLDIKQVREALVFLAKAVAGEPSADTGDAGKNAPKPGDGTAAE